jgi:hypothetical protein
MKVNHLSGALYWHRLGGIRDAELFPGFGCRGEHLMEFVEFVEFVARASSSNWSSHTYAGKPRFIFFVDSTLGFTINR